MPESKAQVRAAFAVKGGKSGIMPREVAEEIIQKLKKGHYKRLPERAKGGKR